MTLLLKWIVNFCCLLQIHGNYFNMNGIEKNTQETNALTEEINQTIGKEKINGLKIVM